MTIIIAFVLIVLIYLAVSYVLYRRGQKFQVGSFWEYCIPLYRKHKEENQAYDSYEDSAGTGENSANDSDESKEETATDSPVDKTEDAFNPQAEPANLITDTPHVDEDLQEPEQEEISPQPKKTYKTKRSLISYIKRMPVMAGFFTRQINELVGIDIGTTSIKVCALSNTKGFFAVNNVVLKTYEQDLLNDGHVVDPDFLGNELREIFEENKIKSRNVACALSSYSVISKKISVPYLQDEELEKAISAEVENAIPFPLQDIYYSYYVLGMDAEKQSMMDVKIVAAKKEIVDGYIAAFNLADLALQIIDVDIFDVSNIVEQIYSPKESSAVIVDIGASVTNIAILNGEEIEFTREILVGGKYLTSLIQKSSRISYHNAEEKKLAADSDIAYLFEDFIFNIASEINKTVRFYLATKPKENIGRIYVTGGSSLLPGLKEKIVEDTGIQVEVINPFLLVQDGDAKDESYQNLKEFMVVPLYLSTRITDIML